MGFYPSDAALACEDNTLKATIPATQSGSITPCLVGKATARANSYEGYDIELKQLFCTMYVSVKKGNYSISKAVVKANGGETIAGDISIGIDDGSVNASAQTITVTPPSPIDCTGEARLIPVMIAPVTLSQGYTVTLTDTDGHSFSVGSTDAVTLTAGDKIETDDARSTEVTELIFCGDNMVYMIDAGLADETGYKKPSRGVGTPPPPQRRSGWPHRAATISTTANPSTTARSSWSRVPTTGARCSTSQPGRCFSTPRRPPTPIRRRCSRTTASP